MPSTIPDWAILIGLIGSIVTLIGVLVRVSNHIGALTYKMNAMTVDWYEGRDGEKPLRDQIAEIKRLVESTEYNIKPNHGSSAHDRIYRKIDGLSSDVYDLMRTVTLDQKRMKEQMETNQDELTGRSH